MALSKNLKLTNNFNEESLFPNSYIKVNSVSGDKKYITAIVYFYKNKDENLLVQKQYTFAVNLEGKNFIAQAYDHLKTLPEFEGATDC